MQEAAQVLVLLAALGAALPARAALDQGPAASAPQPDAPQSGAQPQPGAQPQSGEQPQPDAPPSGTQPLPGAPAAVQPPDVAAPPPPETGFEGAGASAAQDEIHAVQKKPLREARRLELWAYGAGGIGDPYLQRWGGGVRALWHAREGLALGLDARAFQTYRTEELVIAKRELHARILESRERASVAAVAALAPLYGKVALPADLLLHFEAFVDAGLGAAYTETDSGRGVRPMVMAGVGQRLFLGDNLAFTVRVGGEMYAERYQLTSGPATHAAGFWTFALGLSLYLPGQKGYEP